MQGCTGEPETMIPSLVLQGLESHSYQQWLSLLLCLCGHKAQASPSDVPKFTGWAQNQRAVPTESSCCFPNGAASDYIQLLTTVYRQEGFLEMFSKKPESTVTTLFSMMLAANKSRLFCQDYQLTELHPNSTYFITFSVP